MKNNQKKYDTSQEIFYTVCETAWNLCSRYLVDFAAFKGYYTEKYITDALKAVRDAKNQTGNSQTQAEHKEMRNDMVKAAGQVLHNWQILKQYIYTTYAADIAEIKIQMAGGASYKKAFLHNWRSLWRLIDSANSILESEFNHLTANQNMPPVFKEKFAATANIFLQLSNTYFNAKICSPEKTGSRLKANNNMYDTLITMMKDAKQIFYHQPAIKKQFVFSNLVSKYENKNTVSKTTAVDAGENTFVQHVLAATFKDIKDKDQQNNMLKNVA